jgi:hypothetical protein
MAKRREFQVITGLPPDEFLSRLAELSGDGWEVDAFETGSVGGVAGTYTALVSRERRRAGRSGDTDD